MVINVKWDDVDILKVSKRHNMYVSEIVTANIEEVIKRGMPMSLISNIKLMSKEMPDFVMSRLPSIQMIKKEIKVVSSNLESNILEYINCTKCRRMNDKFSLEVK